MQCAVPLLCNRSLRYLLLEMRSYLVNEVENEWAYTLIVVLKTYEVNKR